MPTTRRLLALSVLVLAISADPLAASAQTGKLVFVQPTGPQCVAAMQSYGANAIQTGAGTRQFVVGPATPPLNDGSARFDIAADPAGAGDIAAGLTVQPVAAGIPFEELLNILISITYQHYLIASPSGYGTGFHIFIDHNDDGSPDDEVVFQPAEQPVSCAVLGAWAECDVRNGKFSSLQGLLPPGFSLEEYRDAFPGTTMPVPPHRLLGFVTGGSVAFSNVSAAVDNLHIDKTVPIPYESTTVITDFEPDCSHYGGDADDDCLCDGPFGTERVVNGDVCLGDDTNPDADFDRVCDTIDNCPANSNPSQDNSDGDPLGNACDNCPNATNPGQEDSDTDDIGDACDLCPGSTDIDLDGVCGPDDNCPSASNVDQGDSDGDGVGDVCDPFPNTPDGDGDGVNDDTDNCVGVANPGQEDTDGDGSGDACDAEKVSWSRITANDVLTRPSADKWSVTGDLNATSSPGLLSQVASSGISIRLMRLGPAGELAREAFAASDCQFTNARMNGIRCRNAAGSSLKLSKRPAPSFFRVTVQARGVEFAQPLGGSGLRATLITAPTEQRSDELESCETRPSVRMSCRP